MNNLIPIEPEYIYTTIPAEYVCVYHRILAMMADFGEEMLKDCKATCTDKNTGVIECFNTFNAAVAARKLGKTKLAETLIKYIKAKINQIYKGADNSTSFVFPVDENGVLKAFVSCNDRPRFYVYEEDLYMQGQGHGIEDNYSLEDENNPTYNNPFDFICYAGIEDNKILIHKIDYFFNKLPFKEGEDEITVEYYVNGRYVKHLEDCTVSDTMTVALKVVAYYKGYTNNHDYALRLV